MLTTRVVHLNKEPYDVRIDRQTIYGNPWSRNAGSNAEFIVRKHEDPIACYRDWLLGVRFQDVLQERRGQILASLPELRGKALGCWCKPSACHGDALVELIEYQPPTATTIVVARRPLVGSVVDNIQKWGCGAINIDGSRVGGGELLKGGGGKLWSHYRDGTEDRAAPQINPGLGRWPANLILSHQQTCTLKGTKQVGKGDKIVGGPPRSQSKHIQQMSEQPRTEAIMSYGEETVEDWECVEECAVGDLGERSGVCPSTGNYPSDAKPISKFRPVQGSYQPQGRLYTDNGTAARFYKQFQEGIMRIPQQLIDYLHTMITPPDGETLVVLDPGQIDWGSYADNQLHGLIGHGDPEPYLDQIWRILRPGAHILWIAPDSEPVGFEAACALEDQGFEIRDSICWARRAGGLHYVPKAASSERDAGLGGERNQHPTVKPIELMEKLLADVSTKSTVLDPFAGSGTTGIAALRTGHDTILIDQDEEYVKIATRRIRHWDSATAGWSGADIESEADEPDQEPEEFDLFGG